MLTSQCHQGCNSPATKPQVKNMSWVSLLAAGLTHVPVRDISSETCRGASVLLGSFTRQSGQVAVGAAALKLPRGRNWFYLYYISDHANY